MANFKNVNWKEKRMSDYRKQVKNRCVEETMKLEYARLWSAERFKEYAQDFLAYLTKNGVDITETEFRDTKAKICGMRGEERLEAKMSLMNVYQKPDQCWPGLSLKVVNPVAEVSLCDIVLNYTIPKEMVKEKEDDE